MPSRALAQFTLPAAIYLMCHAEKPDSHDDSHLSEAGKARAQKLVSYFPRLVGKASLDYIFATAPPKHSNRPVETVAPLAHSRGVSINDSYTDAEYRALAQVIRSQDAYAGKTILICWHHEILPALAQRLGATGAPTQWPGSSFDRIWKLTYSRDGSAKLSQIIEPF